MVLNVNTRWLFLGIAALFIVSRKKLIQLFDPILAILLFTYCGWCFLTSFWSEIPILSFAKSSLFVITLPIMIGIGIEWMRTRPWQNIFDYLSIISIFILLAGILGKQSLMPNQNYRGLVTGGSNMFGFMMAVILPFFLWNAYKQWKNKKMLAIWCVLIIASYHYVFLSMSRSSIFLALAILIGLLANLKLEKKIILLLSFLPVTFCLILINPDFLENSALDAVKTYIYKGSDKGIFTSRSVPWQNSYEGAVEGGLSGLGFGVSWGNSDFTFDNGLTSGIYAREKGNSQLAIVEETGIIGLVLYSLIIIYLFITLARIYLKVNNHDQKILLGIITGLFIGLIFTSIFEAWWDSPGVQESIYFWILIGIIRGLELHIDFNNTHRGLSQGHIRYK